MTLHLRSGATGTATATVDADIAIACDGVTRAKAFLTGRSDVCTGSIQTGNIVIYPIDNPELAAVSVGEARSPYVRGPGRER